MTHSKELNERSPLRLFDRSIHGGLGRGNLGVVCAGAGAGKTAFLVAVALDHLMREQQVLHVALDHPVDRVRNYYDEIFTEMVRSEHLEDAGEVRLRVERNRRIQAYAPQAFEVGRLDRTLTLFQEHAGTSPDLIVMDGWTWGSERVAQLEELKALARARHAELWMSASVDGDRPLAPALEPLIDVLVQLNADGGTVHLQLLKDHQHPVAADVALDLDPTTLLLKHAGG